MILKNKKIVITGGAEGLGFSLAKAFIHEGATVYIIGRTQSKIDHAVKKLGNNAQGFIADVSQFSQIQNVAKKLGPIDILINNAGVWIEGPLSTNTEEEISRAIESNLKGVIFTTKAFLPQIEKSEETHIINISSTSGLKGRDGQSVYVATKFGVTGFTESLKMDLAHTNIKVSGFYPGGMSTTLFEKAGSPKKNDDWMDTDKVAEVIIFMVKRDATMILDHVVLNKRGAKTSN